MIVATTIRPSVLQEEIASTLDAATDSTWAERIIEYAGRVCYASEPNMGKASGFILDRVREGHEDIVEHAWVSYLVERMSLEEQIGLMRASRHVEITPRPNGVYVSGNLRVWRDLIKAGLVGQGVAEQIAATAPQVFADLVVATKPERSVFTYQYMHPQGITSEVDLLGWCYNPAYCDDEHQHATFVINGISRSATHQLVRHRMASFSQASQRYISLEKGQWKAVIPPSIAADDRAQAMLDRFWREAEHTYADLRRIGTRKEDARSVLPNAAASKIVVSMSFKYWKHFLWLRALDKAAQWEIRAIGQDILRILCAIAPANFIKEMDYFVDHESTLAGR